MSKYSEISVVELKTKERRLISDTEALRVKVIIELNTIEKNCAEIRNIQLELIERENDSTSKTE